MTSLSFSAYYLSLFLSRQARIANRHARIRKYTEIMYCKNGSTEFEKAIEAKNKESKHLPQ